jgi:hypothetical protein
MSKRSSRLIAALTAAGWLLCAGPLAAEIYKTVDENGNVVYTDQPPGGDAEPLTLPGLSVIATVRPEPKEEPEVEEDDQQDVTSIRDLRRGYRDFSIVNPAAEQTIWGANNEVTIAWDTRYRLQRGMTVTLFLDGSAREPTTDQTVTLSRLDRGAHTVYAELIDARNRKIATTEPVTFYIQQHSVITGANRSPGG